MTLKRMWKVNYFTKLTVLGLAIPGFLVWLGYWLAFEIGPVAGTLHNLYNGEYAETFRSELPARVEQIANLGMQRGALFIIGGFVSIILGLLISRLVFGKAQALMREVGSVRLVSYLYAFVAFVLLLAVFKLALYIAQIDVNALSDLLASLAPYIGY